MRPKLRQGRLSCSLALDVSVRRPHTFSLNFNLFRCNQPVRVDPHDNVGNRSLDLAKPMRHTRGNNNHVARLYLPAHTTFNTGAASAWSIFQPGGYGVSRSGLRV